MAALIVLSIALPSEPAIANTSGVNQRINCLELLSSWTFRPFDEIQIKPEDFDTPSIQSIEDSLGPVLSLRPADSLQTSLTTPSTIGSRLRGFIDSVRSIRFSTKTTVNPPEQIVAQWMGVIKTAGADLLLQPILDGQVRLRVSTRYRWRTDRTTVWRRVGSKYDLYIRMPNPRNPHDQAVALWQFVLSLYEILNYRSFIHLSPDLWQDKSARSFNALMKALSGNSSDDLLMALSPATKVKADWESVMHKILPGMYLIYNSLNTLQRPDVDLQGADIPVFKYVDLIGVVLPPQLNPFSENFLNPFYANRPFHTPNKADAEKAFFEPEDFVNNVVVRQSGKMTLAFYLDQLRKLALIGYLVGGPVGASYLYFNIPPTIVEFSDQADVSAELREARENYATLEKLSQSTYLTEAQRQDKKYQMLQMRIQWCGGKGYNYCLSPQK